MTFGEDWGWGASPDECKSIYQAFREAGGNFIDTANIYTNGTSEKYVGELISSEREAIVVATKYSNGVPYPLRRSIIKAAVMALATANPTAISITSRNPSTNAAAIARFNATSTSALNLVARLLPG